MNLLEELYEKAKKDQKSLKKLKVLATEMQQYELAAELRTLEQQLYPVSEDTKKIYTEAERLNLAFRMVELNVPIDACWLIAETVKMHSKMKGKFSLNEASALKAKAQELFENYHG